MNFQESLKYLYSLGYETLAMKFGLHNTQTLLAGLDHPQTSFFKIQIAGTNGKGSVAAFLYSICLQAEIETGLFTSPHLISINERIQTNGFKITEPAFAALTTEVSVTANRLVAEGKLEALPTFFEHLTAIGLLAFAREKVEIAILETGLGGRLDSVTAAEAEIIGITPVSFDHQEYLGDTLSEIAAEKAAVIRPDVRAVVVSKQEPEAMRVIRGRCRENRIEPVLAEKGSIQIHGLIGGWFETTFTTETDVYSKVLVQLPGRHQLDNALTAIHLAESLRNAGFKITKEDIIYGLEAARHSGRLDYLRTADGVGVLFDGAHNAAGAKTLREYLQEFFPNVPLTLIFGAMRDKDLSEITAELFPFAENLILTAPNNPRSTTPETLAAFVPPDKKVFLTPRVRDALQKAREVTPQNGLICVTGSLYLVGEAQSILLNE